MSARHMTRKTRSRFFEVQGVRGWDAKIETFTVLYPTPKERVLEMVAPTRFTAKLQEPPLSVDPTSNQQSEQLPSYNAYSIDGCQVCAPKPTAPRAQ